MKKRTTSLLKSALPNIIVVGCGVTLFAFYQNAQNIGSGLSWFITLISPFLWGAGLAYLLSPLLNFLENKTPIKKVKSHRLKRAISLVLTVSAFLGLLVGFFWVLVPQLQESILQIYRLFPDSLDSIINFAKDLFKQYNLKPEWLDQLGASSQQIIAKILAFVKDSLPHLLNAGFSVGKGLVNVLIAFISAIYLLIDKEKMISQAKRITYAISHKKEVADRLIEVCQLSNETFGGFLVGKLLDSLVIGIFCYIGTSLLHIPYALLVSVIVGVTNIIPFFGPFIGAIPASFIILIADPIKAIWFVIFVIALQQLDGNIIGPMLLGESTGLSAFWVTVAIIVGGGYMGLLGMIIGVPAFSVIYTLFRVFIANKLHQKGMSTDGEDYKQVGIYTKSDPDLTDLEELFEQDLNQELDPDLFDDTQL